WAYTLALHDALPIYPEQVADDAGRGGPPAGREDATLPAVVRHLGSHKEEVCEPQGSDRCQLLLEALPGGDERLALVAFEQGGVAPLHDVLLCAAPVRHAGLWGHQTVGQELEVAALGYPVGVQGTLGERQSGGDLVGGGEVLAGVLRTPPMRLLHAEAQPPARERVVE